LVLRCSYRGKEEDKRRKVASKAAAAAAAATAIRSAAAAAASIVRPAVRPFPHAEAAGTSKVWTARDRGSKKVPFWSTRCWIEMGKEGRRIEEEKD
jgi:hypothetical protein